MELHNAGETADRLIAAESPVAELVQLHTHIEDNGVMRMRQIEDGIPLAPKCHAPSCSAAAITSC